MAILVRSGLFANLDASKMLAREYAVTTDTHQLFYCPQAGTLKEIVTFQDIQDLLNTSEEAYIALLELIDLLEEETVLTGILNDLVSLQLQIDALEGGGAVESIGIFENKVADPTFKYPYGYWGIGYGDNKVVSEVFDDYTKITSVHNGEKGLNASVSIVQNHTYLMLVNQRVLSSNSSVRPRIGIYSSPWFIAGDTPIASSANFNYVGYVYTHTSADVSAFVYLADTDTGALEMDLKQLLFLDITGSDLATMTYSEIIATHLDDLIDVRGNSSLVGYGSKIEYLLQETTPNTVYDTEEFTNPYTKDFIVTNGTKLENSNGIEQVFKSMCFYNNVGFSSISTGSHVIDNTTGRIEHHDEDSYKELKALGFNSVRFYISQYWFEDVSSPVVDATLQGDPDDYNSNAWDFLDVQFAMARKFGFRLCLNLHVYPGNDNMSDDSCWTVENAKLRIINLWKAIATRYVNEDIIWGYGLINEPNISYATDNATTIARYEDLFNRIVTEIRKVDTNHVIVSESAICGVDTFGYKAFELNSDKNFISVENDGVEDANYCHEVHHYEHLAISHNASAHNDISIKYPNNLALVYVSSQTYVNTRNKVKTWAMGSANDGSYALLESDLFAQTATTKFIYPFINIFSMAGGEIIEMSDYKVDVYDGNDKFVETIIMDDCQNGLLFEDHAYWDAEVSDTVQGALNPGRIKLTATGDTTANWSYKQSSQVNDGGVLLSSRWRIPKGYKFKVSAYVKASNISATRDLVFWIGADEDTCDSSYSADEEVHQYLLDGYKGITDTKNVPLFIGEFGVRDDSHVKGGHLWVRDAIRAFIDNKVSHSYHDYYEPDNISNFAMYKILNEVEYKNVTLENVFKEVYGDSVQVQITDATEYKTIADVSNAFTIDCQNLLNINAMLEVANTTAKIISLSNIPTICDLFMEIKFTALADITFFSGITWEKGAEPDFESGKTYRILFYTRDSGTSWHGYATSGV